ncbi:MAG: hypothetical protein ACJ75J_14550 [Cytophagaceae bacterium]
MRKYWFLVGIKCTLFFIAAGTALTYAVMMLWNWLIPAIFGLAQISFLQALGLLILSKILFTGFRRHGCGSSCHKGGEWRKTYWKDRFKEKISTMSPEEQEKFKESFKKCCGWESEKKENQ